MFAVTDDGSGFAQAGFQAGSGVRNMNDRVGALGGTVRVTSTPGVGTSITGTLPMNGAASTDLTALKATLGVTQSVRWLRAGTDAAGDARA